MEGPIIDVTQLKKYFPMKRNIFFRKRPDLLKAVDGTSFSIKPGETFGLVGESGCGKSTVAKTLLKILAPTSGRIEFMGQDISTLRGRKLFDFRCAIQAVYQDPYSSLNPRMRIGKIIGEPLKTLELLSGRKKEEKVYGLLEKVGLQPGQARRYPHEFSGGQRQRIGIARALSVDPRFLILDEPVSALDVSIRSQILNLLADLQEEFRLTYFFISHDLSVVEHICDRVAVMYLGKIIEEAPKRKFFDSPAHPYSKALLSAVPVPDPDRSLKMIPLEGEIPSPLNPPSGCHFHPRCPSKMKICKQEAPEKITVDGDHGVRCHLYS